mmetsp:Transcript_16953/g.50009  ORF Transcript_16953/g.50009 Transcript_16953/m.50009 type:complete len:216 (+) Transcript_16953:1596-2243(+)
MLPRWVVSLRRLAARPPASTSTEPRPEAYGNAGSSASTTDAKSASCTHFACFLIKNLKTSLRMSSYGAAALGGVHQYRFFGSREPLPSKRLLNSAATPGSPPLYPTTTTRVELGRDDRSVWAMLSPPVMSRHAVRAAASPRSFTTATSRRPAASFNLLCRLRTLSLTPSTASSGRFHTTGSTSSASSKRASKFVVRINGSWRRGHDSFMMYASFL